MAEQFRSKILQHLQSGQYQPQKPRRLFRELEGQEEDYGSFHAALKELMHEGRVVRGARGALVLPGQQANRNEFIGVYRHNRRGFGFVIPSDPQSHEDLYIPEGLNLGAITGDVVRAKIIERGQRDGKAIYAGRVIEIVERKNKRFVGTLAREGGTWMVHPDGNALTEVILTPDAAARHIRLGTKVVVELTTYPENGQRAEGVITEVLGKAGEKDVDLKSVIVQFNLPAEFPDEVRDQARQAVDSFDPKSETADRLDLTREVVCTIDPPDAKDYDDAISLKEVEAGYWELGVHIADVSRFVPAGSALDVEAQQRGNSSYFPGHVIPMLPEILSNGVCSLQEGVPRLCKSAFITFDDDARPLRARFANTIISSSKRLRYIEAQAIIDREQTVPHPDGPRKLSDYPETVVDLLDQMNTLAKRIQKRRLKQGQIVLDLPEVNLVLDEDGKIVGAEEEDQSFTHTLIEMFMVEANEAVARLLASLDVPFLRRIHPEPETDSSARLAHFVQVAGYRLPKELDRKALQALLHAVRGKPEAFAINLAVLKSLSRAEYSPEAIGHYALASECYGHFTSPIRRYADLTVHRLLDSYLAALDRSGKHSRKHKPQLDDVIPYDDLVKLGQHLSFTERRSDDAERELRQVKILELLRGQIGEEFTGVVTGITNFGIFVQIQKYLVDGLIRYEDLMDDWWDVDERSGVIRGQRSGTRIGIGDLVKVYVVRVDVPRRELSLAISQVLGKRGGEAKAETKPRKPEKTGKKEWVQKSHRTHRKGKGRG